MGASAIALCPQCRRDTVPRLKAPSYLADMWRAPSKGMERPVDPEAEAVRARKERKQAKKQSFRSIVKADGILAATKLFLAGRAEEFAATEDEECPMCLKRSRENAQRIARSPRRGAYGMVKAIVLVHRADAKPQRPALEPKDTRRELDFDQR